jgi:tryptophanyl-tRNA synthetase
LELTRDIARRFNDLFSKERRPAFTEPQGLIVKEGARVMSLLDGTSKMSKSAENDGSRINLLDSPDIIAKKIKRCKTDAIRGLEWDNESRPECVNLLNIYRAVTNKTREAVLTEVADMSWGSFKPVVTEALIEHLKPIQAKYQEVVSDQSYLAKILADGREAANAVAEKTLRGVKEDMGFDIPATR